MQPYQVMVMIDPEVDEDRQGDILERVRSIVQGGGGEFEAVDAWGRRKLAYEIDKKGEAFYFVVTFRCTPETLDEVSRVLRITDEVMRHMPTVRTGRSHGAVEDVAPVS